jgi:hypothetical protein
VDNIFLLKKKEVMAFNKTDFYMPGYNILGGENEEKRDISFSSGSGANRWIGCGWLCKTGTSSGSSTSSRSGSSTGST